MTSFKKTKQKQKFFSKLYNLRNKNIIIMCTQRHVIQIQKQTKNSYELLELLSIVDIVSEELKRNAFGILAILENNVSNE